MPDPKDKKDPFLGELPDKDDPRGDFSRKNYTPDDSRNYNYDEKPFHEQEEENEESE